MLCFGDPEIFVKFTASSISLKFFAVYSSFCFGNLKYGARNCNYNHQVNIDFTTYNLTGVCVFQRPKTNLLYVFADVNISSQDLPSDFLFVGFPYIIYNVFEETLVL